MSTERKELEVDVRFGAYFGGGNKDNGGFILRLDDKTSGLRVAEVELTFKQVGEMLAGQGASAPAEVFVSENHGKKREAMKLKVDIDSGAWPSRNADPEWVEIARQARAEAYRQALVDGGYAQESGLGQNNGWTASDDDDYNHHRRSGDGYLVTFTRYVDPEVTV